MTMEIFLTISCILAVIFFGDWIYNVLSDAIDYYDNHKKK